MPGPFRRLAASASNPIRGRARAAELRHYVLHADVRLEFQDARLAPEALTRGLPGVTTWAFGASLNGASRKRERTGFTGEVGGPVFLLRREVPNVATSLRRSNTRLTAYLSAEIMPQPRAANSLRCVRRPPPRTSSWPSFPHLWRMGRTSALPGSSCCSSNWRQVARFSLRQHSRLARSPRPRANARSTACGLVAVRQLDLDVLLSTGHGAAPYCPPAKEPAVAINTR